MQNKATVVAMREAAQVATQYEDVVGDSSESMPPTSFIDGLTLRFLGSLSDTGWNFPAMTTRK